MRPRGQPPEQPSHPPEPANPTEAPHHGANRTQPDPAEEETAPGPRGHLRAVVSSTAAPYGYTLSLWAAGSLAIGEAGRFPPAVDIGLFVCGAIAGFGLLAAVTIGGLRGPLTTSRARVRAWGGAHLPAVGGSVLVSTGLVHLLHGHLIWPVAGFGVTTVYLTLLAGQFWLASRPPRRGSA